MKKITLLIAAVLMSAGCYAQGVLLNSFNCVTMGEDLGGCFQNKTGVDIGNHDLYLKEKLNFTNGSTEDYLSTLSQFNPNRYIVTSWTTGGLKKNKISSVSYTITYNGKPVPGCYFNVTANAGKHPTIAITKTGNELHC